MSEMKEKMQNLKVTGKAGGGLVEVTMNGEKEVQKVKINPDCVDKEDVEGLEDLIMVAFQEAAKEVDSQSPDNNLFSMNLS